MRTRPKFFRLSLLVWGAALFLPGPGAAVSLFDPRQSNSLDDANAFARSAAMGSALVGAPGAASALIDNPAGLSRIDRPELSANSHFWLVDTFQETFLWAMPGPSRSGGWGIAGSYLNFGSFEGRDGAGSLASDYSAHLFLLKAGWGLEILKGFSLGAGFQGGELHIASASSWSFAGDFGALLDLSDQFKVGASCGNLEFGDGPWRERASFHLGASYGTPVNHSDSLILALGGNLNPNRYDEMQAGVEYGFQSLLFLRAGYQVPLNENGIGGLTGFTAGVGFALSDFKLDYAYLPYGELGSAHRVSVGYQFGSGPGRPLSARAPKVPAQAAGLESKPINRLSNPAAVLNQAGNRAAASPGGSTVTVFNPSGDSSQVPSSGEVLPKLLGDRAAEKKDPLAIEFDFPSEASARGKELEKQGKYKEASQLYIESLKKDGEDAAVWMALGNLYDRFHQKDSAVHCYEQLIRLEPDNRKMIDWLKRYKEPQP